MKKLHKSLIATAVAAVMAPSAFSIEAEAPEFHGSFDITMGLKMAEESAFAIDDAPGDWNYLGLEGEVKLDNGSALTYSYYEAVYLTDQAGFGGTYGAHIGYKMDSIEIQAGTLDTPLRRVLDKADMFAGTYADANNVVAINTTAANTALLLGGTDTFVFGVSLSFTDENPNNTDTTKAIMYGALVDFTISDTLSIAGGLEMLDNQYTAFGVSANIDVAESVSLAFGLNIMDLDAAYAFQPASQSPGGMVLAADTSPMSFTAAASMPMSEKSLIKAQLGYGDPDVDGVDAGMFFAVGYDHQLAEAVTGYFLFATGTDKGLNIGMPNGTGADAANVTDSASVLATGLKVAF